MPDTGDFHADCVARINQFRWECQCLPPLERWLEAEDCADQMAEYDAGLDEAHAGIRAEICEPSNAAQNECLNYGPSFGIIDFCFQQMWDEGPGEDFQVHGHYLNMSDPTSTRVGCGIYVAPNGDVTSVQNFQ
ncbi:MAG TPA: CAP domain-containing protein [Polyangiaceae bacterium]|nr:CAP domain-containing protein [Polyangiaceae bacterium]